MITKPTSAKSPVSHLHQHALSRKARQVSSRNCRGTSLPHDHTLEHPAALPSLHNPAATQRHPNSCRRHARVCIVELIDMIQPTLSRSRTVVPRAVLHNLFALKPIQTMLAADSYSSESDDIHWTGRHLQQGSNGGCVRGAMDAVPTPQSALLLMM